jgi:cell division transport system ATP-binding protein
MVLVDEPTGNLDADTTERVVRLLNNSHKSGATVVIATHDTSLYHNSSCRIMELKGGAIHAIAGGDRA